MITGKRVLISMNKAALVGSLVETERKNVHFAERRKLLIGKGILKDTMKVCFQ